MNINHKIYLKITPIDIFGNNKSNSMYERIAHTRIRWSGHSEAVASSSCSVHGSRVYEWSNRDSQRPVQVTGKKTNYLIDRYLSNLITKFKRFKHNKILEKLCLRFQIIILKRNITIKKLFLLYEIVLDLNYISFLLSLNERLIIFLFTIEKSTQTAPSRS